MGEVLLDDDPVIDRSNQLHPPGAAIFAASPSVRNGGTAPNAN